MVVQNRRRGHGPDRIKLVAPHRGLGDAVTGQTFHRLAKVALLHQRDLVHAKPREIGGGIQ
jgi:hypothetical protein